MYLRSGHCTKNSIRCSFFFNSLYFIEPFEVIWGLPVILYLKAVSGWSKYFGLYICNVIVRFWRRRIIDNTHLESNKDLFLSIDFDL